jgi:hypothetical protein
VRIFILLPLGGMAVTGGPSTEWEKIIDFIFFLQFPIIILIICLQQYKKYKRLGYFTLFLILFSYYFPSFYEMPVVIDQEFLSTILNIFRDPISAIYEVILVLENLIPVYVLAKTGYEDLFKKGRLKK